MTDSIPEDEETILAAQRALDPEKEGNLTFQGKKIRIDVVRSSVRFASIMLYCRKFWIIFLTKLISQVERGISWEPNYSQVGKR
jgi:hypothetical protein